MSTHGIRAFDPSAAADSAAWRSLNEAWLAEGGFAIEAKDRKVLDDPQGQILAQGGRIFFIQRGDDVVGCCALMAMDDGGFEVAKMTIAPAARGHGLSRRLLEVCEDAAREAGAQRLYLETSSTLGPALALYDSFGFVRLPPRETPYVRADVFMEKALV
ncbi:GNAT family N-acetyltransferase [Brevundimonas olei]|uniref:GNAT family N-acetyltransferase n=1 Tax=Brevundimonas olei TaxID=657642 RepID=UPI0031E3C6D5